MQIKELRDKSKPELQKLLAERRAELQSLRFAVAGRKDTHIRKIRELRKDIARVLTLLNKSQ